MEAQEAELVGALRQQQRALAEQTARTERAEAGLREAASQVDRLRTSVASGVPISAQIRSAVDTRTLGKPHSFSGRREARREF